ncbi:hypothetical protein CRENBAI_023722 [Crenichthys baileyi]|uniref:Uncharacterized protein n=1 Tax=Crenichthys baileyi TaxID=28760 RepID=A0AAV9SSB3_9TELE
MTEGTSQRDQAGGMERQFKRDEVIVKLFSHLVTSPSSPWKRLEIAGSLQDWLEVWRDFFFPDPHHTINAKRQRALGEIAASVRRPPAPSSARLSTEAGGGFPAHGFTPDKPSGLLILFLVLFRRGSWINRLHTPILVLSRGCSWMSCLHTLILFLVLFWRGSWMNRLPVADAGLSRRGSSISRSLIRSFHCQSKRDSASGRSSNHHAEAERPGQPRPAHCPIDPQRR